MAVAPSGTKPVATAMLPLFPALPPLPPLPADVTIAWAP